MVLATNTADKKWQVDAVEEIFVNATDYDKDFGKFFIQNEGLTKFSFSMHSFSELKTIRQTIYSL